MPRTTLAVIALSMATQFAGPPAYAQDAETPFPPGPAEGVSADLDCASLYTMFTSLSDQLANGAGRDGFDARARQAVQAHMDANSGVDWQEDANRQFLVDATQRWPEAFSTRLAQLQAVTSGQERAAGVTRVGGTSWAALLSCDARYGHAPLPSPFAWID